MDFSGSMWRVKQRSLSMAILPQPMMYFDWINSVLSSELADNLYLQVGSIIIVADDVLNTSVIPRRQEDPSCRFQTFRRVVAPAFGYLNSTYFLKDSMWLERLT